MHMPPSQHLTPFFDILGWLQDSIDQAVQPLVHEISVLKDRVSRLEEEVKQLKVEPLVQGQAQAQAQGVQSIKRLVFYEVDYR